MAKKSLILIGHGAVPTDCPPALAAEFKRLEASSRGKPSAEFHAVDHKLRSWPRTPQTDPYKAGLEALAQALAKVLPDHSVTTAYNEFCAPDLEQAFDEALRQGALEVTAISTMYTRGGLHSEREIPEIMESLRRRHPNISVHYCWPFDLGNVAQMLASEVNKIEGR
jgi:sirohydrochlorin cobaltochelatase